MEEETKTEGEEKTSSESSTEEKQEESTQSDGGENTQTEKDIPFHEHPRWKEREEAWNRRLEEQKQEFDRKLESFKPKESEEKVVIPKWWGGDEAQFRDFQQSQEALVAKAEERAIARLNETRSLENKRTAEANEHFADSLATIKELTGEVADQDKLLAYVMEKKLIDKQGHWDYLKGYNQMKNADTQGDSLQQRRRLASATSKDSGGGHGPEVKDYATSEDFAKPGSRPW